MSPPRCCAWSESSHDESLEIQIAQLATAGQARAPLAVASQVFSDLVLELERQGVSRKVTADMFGLSLRRFQRKMQRMEESSTERGRSTSEAVLEFVRSRDFVTLEGLGHQAHLDGSLK